MQEENNVQPHELETTKVNEINTNWLEKEFEDIEINKPTGDYPPAMMLEEGKITEFDINFSKPFEKWTDPNGTVKKIIPVKHNGIDKVFWINTRNPTYKEIIELGNNGVTHFKIFRTGKEKMTRYSIVKE